MGTSEFNSTAVAKQIFGCVYKINQRFGISYIASVLAGAKLQKIVKYKHDQIASYGALKEYSLAQIRVFINQLIDQGFLEKTQSQYPVIKLLKLTDEVKAGRLEVKLAVPDPALARKSESERGESVAKTLALYKDGRSILEIAKERGLAPGTILSHLAQAYQQGESIDIDQFVPAQRQAEITQVFQKLGTDYLSPVKRDLGQSCSWEELKWVRAKLLRAEPATA